MSEQRTKITALYSKSQSLFLQLSAYFTKLTHDYTTSNLPTMDQQKILKLFSYNSWEQYMKWIEQKLEESGEGGGEQNNRRLEEIIQEQPDMQQSISEPTLHMKEQGRGKAVRCQILAIQNGKLRRQNIILQDQIENIRNHLRYKYFLINA